MKKYLTRKEVYKVFDNAINDLIKANDWLNDNSFEIIDDYVSYDGCRLELWCNWGDDKVCELSFIKVGDDSWIEEV